MYVLLGPYCCGGTSSPCGGRPGPGAGACPGPSPGVVRDEFLGGRGGRRRPEQQELLGHRAQAHRSQDHILLRLG